MGDDAEYILHIFPHFEVLDSFPDVFMYIGRELVVSFIYTKCRLKFVNLFFLCQVMLVGDSAVGKTCLLIKFREGSFLSGSFISTIGIDFRVSHLVHIILFKRACMVYA